MRRLVSYRLPGKRAETFGRSRMVRDNGFSGMSSSIAITEKFRPRGKVLPAAPSYRPVPAMQRRGDNLAGRKPAILLNT